MINTPQTRTDRRLRLGASSVLRHVSQKPSAILSIGNKRQAVEILGAVGFDVHALTASDMTVGQRVTLILPLSETEPEMAMPGTVHWVGSGDSAGQVGIVLQETLPQELSVRIPGCQRNSIRYSCRVHGSMIWTDAVKTSTAAIAMNYSRDGICLQVTAAPPVETKVRFAWQSCGMEIYTEGMIRWVIGQETGFLTGCELLQDRGYKLSGVDG